MNHNKKEKLSAWLSGMGRIAIVAVLIIGELVLMGFVTYWLKGSAPYASSLLSLAGLLVALYLMNKPGSAADKIAWILIVLVMPVFGLFLYLAWGRVNINRRERGAIEAAFGKGGEMLVQDKSVQAAMEEAHPLPARHSAYLRQCGFPAFAGTDTKYYTIGEDLFEDLLLDLRQAKKTIFICYFIVDVGELWDRFYPILKEKAAAGVDVRLFYDDLGCIFTLPKHFRETLMADGIQVQVFNPAHRYISSLYLNFRNHQKIVVIDSNISDTGGVNLADEYANIIHPHGHWKDTGIRMEGQATWGMTVQFLKMWDLCRRAVTDNYEDYRPTVTGGDGGFYQPYADGPNNNPENPAEDTFVQMLGLARRYLYITTPYLVIDGPVMDAFCLAARSGVDVRLYTPGVSDHGYVQVISQQNYGRLIKAGVKIFEYTPGFIHAKMAVYDDEAGFIGSVNLDNRSFNLHYENGVFFAGGPLPAAILADIQDIESKSQQYTLERWSSRPWHTRAYAKVLEVLSPML